MDTLLNFFHNLSSYVILHFLLDHLFPMIVLTWGIHLLVVITSQKLYLISFWHFYYFLKYLSFLMFVHLLICSSVNFQMQMKVQVPHQYNNVVWAMHLISFFLEFNEIVFFCAKDLSNWGYFCLYLLFLFIQLSCFPLKFNKPPK